MLSAVKAGCCKAQPAAMGRLTRSAGSKYTSLVGSTRNQLPQFRTHTTLNEVDDAEQAWKTSCYYEMDFTIPDEATVYEAVQKFAAFNVGAFVTVDASGNISGVISERDYINKVALLGKKSKELKVKEISTKSANLMTAKPSDSIDDCMKKMLDREIRHLPLLDDSGKVIGMLSIKDIVKAILQDKEKQMEVLTNFALGKGGHFGSD